MVLDSSSLSTQELPDWTTAAGPSLDDKLPEREVALHYSASQACWLLDQHGSNAMHDGRFLFDHSIAS